MTGQGITMASPIITSSISPVINAIHISQIFSSHRQGDQNLIGRSQSAFCSTIFHWCILWLGLFNVSMRAWHQCHNWLGRDRWQSVHWILIHTGPWDYATVHNILWYHGPSTMPQHHHGPNTMDLTPCLNTTLLSHVLLRPVYTPTQQKSASHWSEFHWSARPALIFILTMKCFNIVFSGQPGLQVEHKTISHQIKSNVFVTYTWLADDVNASVAKCLCF